MVELEPITPENEALENLEHQGGDLEAHGRVDISHYIGRFDAQRLRTLIEKHKQYTNSGWAHQILQNWDNYLPKFIKVMPIDYRRALQELERTQAARQTVHAMQKEAIG
jgi:glutamate synthase (NADPH/NADH) large chain